MPEWGKSEVDNNTFGSLCCQKGENITEANRKKWKGREKKKKGEGDNRSDNKNSH
jgi:hypothetical protein